MAAETDDWPSYASELSRKGMQALKKYVDKHFEGKVSERELYIVTDVLWDTMSGLAHEVDLRIIETLNEEIRRNAKARRKAKSGV